MLDLRDVELSSSAPEGVFDARITEAKKFKTQAGDDAFKIVFTILGPTHAKYKVDNIFNVFHSTNEKVRNGSRKFLKRLVGEIGISEEIDPNDLTPFLNKIVGIKTEKEEYEYEGQKRVKAKLVGFSKSQMQDSVGEDF